jgi:hypothetical protein
MPIERQRDTSAVSESLPRREWRPEDWWLSRRLSAGTREQRTELQQGQSADVRAARYASEHVDDVVSEGGKEAITLVAQLVQSAPDSDALVLVGSGPLEDLLHEHGADLIEEVERLARQVPAFAETLRSVWLEHRALPPEVEARLARWVQVTGPT